jgi:hypothetical protein
MKYWFWVLLPKHIGPHEHLRDAVALADTHEKAVIVRTTEPQWHGTSSPITVQDVEAMQVDPIYLEPGVHDHDAEQLQHAELVEKAKRYIHA